MTLQDMILDIWKYVVKSHKYIWYTWTFEWNNIYSLQNIALIWGGAIFEYVNSAGITGERVILPLYMLV